MGYFWLFAICLCFSSGFYVVDAKECTDSLSRQLPTKTLTYMVMSSNNETWKKMMMPNHNARPHLTPTDESTWSNMIPDNFLMKEKDVISWNAMYRNIKFSATLNVTSSNFLKEIPLQSVRLDPNSLHGQAQGTNVEYLLMLEVDRLVWSFRKTAGLPTPGSPYGGWEAPNIDLRGHFVGHYLSATAQTWASTGNPTIRGKSIALVAALKECQDAMKTGYLSAFPPDLFDTLESLYYVWAPYYTIHKIMAGLFDQYIYAGNSDALKMVTWMADYFYNRVQNVVAKYSIEQHWSTLNEESGGMNDVLYQLYTVTNDQKHLLLAHLFDKPCFLGTLAMKANNLAEFHTNTHIPIVVGAQKRYEITGDELYKDMSTFFLDIVNSTHSYATGGTSVNEHWKDPKRYGDKLSTENEESCTTYNMLKVSRNLFRWTKELTYADYYERALTNGVLSIQKGTDPGVMIYMLPLGHGVSKGRSLHGWGNPFDTFWCCYGTGIESFSKLGDSIYFEEQGNVPRLYVIQYISSSLDWVSARISLTQVVDNVASLDPTFKVQIKVSANQASSFATINLRIPSWTSPNGLKAFVNGVPLNSPAPGNFLSITRKWGSADVIALQFPLLLRTEFVQDDRPEYASLQAILYGHILLAGLSTGDYDIQTGSALQPIQPSQWITPVPADYNSHLVTLTQEIGKDKFFLSYQDQAIKLLTFFDAQNVSYVSATFRLVSNSNVTAGLQGLIGRPVKLEPFDRPGTTVAYSNAQQLTVKDSQASNVPNLSDDFVVVKGLNGANGTISLQTKGGCFVYSGIKQSSFDTNVTLRCGNPSDLVFKDAVSFVWNQGFKQYSPVSFIARGVRRSYVLEPLLGIKDELYNVYFNITQR